jgi:hypothetical protein
MIQDPITDPIGGITTILQPARRLATAEDYAYALVPLHVGGLAFAVIVTLTDTGTAGVCSVAIVFMVCKAMRDQDFSRLVARFADFLKPPKD